MSTSTLNHSYNNSSHSQPYRTWKGTNRYQNPIGTTAGHLRPYTNNDLTNIAEYIGTQNGNIYPRLRSGARPLKWQYRKGSTTQPVIEKVITDSSTNNGYYDIHHLSHTSRTGSLIAQTIDRPGQFTLHLNNQHSSFEQEQSNEEEEEEEEKEKKICTGIELHSNYQPSPSFTETPQSITETNIWCCNEEKKAKQRVLPTNTNLPKTYFTSMHQYRQNRCQTYDQRSFNFTSLLDAPEYNQLYENGITRQHIIEAKPGSPLSLFHMYVANCYPTMYDNYTSTGKDPETGQQLFDMKTGQPLYPMGPSQTIQCKKVIYKPNNAQYATQGSVSSSTRLMKLTMDTLNTNLSNEKKYKGTTSEGNGNQVPFLYKDKVAPPPSCRQSSTCYGKDSESNGIELLYKYGVGKGHVPV